MSPLHHFAGSFLPVPIKLVKLGRKPKLVENLVQKPIIELRSIKNPMVLIQLLMILI